MYPYDVREGAGNLNRPISENAAPGGEDRARQMGSNEHEQETAPEPFIGVQGEGGAGRHQGGQDGGRDCPAIRGAPDQVTEWRKQLLERAGEAFGPSGPTQAPVDVKALHAKIGQLALENDFSYGPRCQAGNAPASRYRDGFCKQESDGQRDARAGVSTMDQAHIRGLGTAVHLSVAGQPRS